jgi:hypothetical protein
MMQRIQRNGKDQRPQKQTRKGRKNAGTQDRYEHDQHYADKKIHEVSGQKSTNGRVIDLHLALLCES